MESDPRNESAKAGWGQPARGAVWSLSLIPFQNDAWTPDVPTIEATIAGIAGAFPHERQAFSVARTAVRTRRPGTRIGKWHRRDVSVPLILSPGADTSRGRFETRISSMRDGRRRFPARIRHECCFSIPNPQHGAVLRIKVIRRPRKDCIDGVDVAHFKVGETYDVGNGVGALFLSEEWTVPVDSDHPAVLIPLPRCEAIRPNTALHGSNDAPRKRRRRLP